VFDTHCYNQGNHRLLVGSISRYFVSSKAAPNLGNSKVILDQFFIKSHLSLGLYHITLFLRFQIKLMELAAEALTKATIVMAPGRVTFARVDSSVEFQAEFTVDLSHNSYPALTGQAYIDNSANLPHIEATKKFVTGPKFQNSNQPTSSYH
jgi:hypothetical protein